MPNKSTTVRPMRGPRGMAPKASLKDINWKTVGRLMKYVLKYKVQLILVIVFIILSAIASVASSVFLGTLIDQYIMPMIGIDNPDFSNLAKALVIMGVIYAIGIASSLLYNRIMVVVSQGTLKTIRDEMFEHMQKLPIKYFDSHSHGDVMSYYTNDTDTLRQVISMSIPQLFSSVITIVSVFCSMLATSLWLSLFVVVCLFFMLKITGKLTSKSGKYFVAQQQSLASVNGYVEEMINGQKVIKVFNHEEKANEEFDEKNQTLYNNASKANIYTTILMPIMNNLGYLLYVFIAIIGGAMAISNITNVRCFGIGVLTLGEIATFLQLSRNFVNPISQISQQFNSIVMALAGAERIFSLLDEKVEEDNGYVTLVNAKINNGIIEETKEKTNKWAWKHPHEDGTLTYTELKGEVLLKDVDFSYDGEKVVLHDITVEAKPGQKVAFVGATGAGKTTITNLINRFYDIADGKIRYDGININKIKKPDLRHSLGVVLQDVNLFTGTIMDNIRYGKLDATDEECIEAAKLAGADSFIGMLPQGYQTVIEGDGSNLSQGQRQLLSIARAAVADPPVMILDEATSSIDTRTEAIVQKGMDAIMKGRTVFVIAHRLSTVRNSDNIMVLDHGKIIERGTHQTLIAQKGAYYRLYTGATELE
jgi:ATP-binding cassette subfamily B multidrug efflux pump